MYSTLGRALRPFAILVVALTSCTPAVRAQTSGGAAPAATAAVTKAKCPSKREGGFVRNLHGKRVIVFVNGIFGNACSTWTNSNGAYWPALIAEDHDFDGVDIYVHNFESPKLARAQQIDELAARLKDYLLVDHVLDRKEVVFIAHSMGGLVTRAFLVNQRDRSEKTPMLFFFATPTAGADVAAIGAHLSANPQLRDMQPLSDGGYVKKLREDWLKTSNDPSLDYPNKIASFCAYEKLNVGGVRIVSELSATYLCNRENRGIQANHIDIVKPSDMGGEPYVIFKAAYSRTFGSLEREVVAALSGFPHDSLTDNHYAVFMSNSALAGFILRQVTARGTYVEVPCGEEKSGDLIARIDLKPEERILDVRPSLANTVNLKFSSIALIRHTRGYAEVRYELRGIDRESLRCPGRGRAEVITNFLVAGPRASLLPEFR